MSAEQEQLNAPPKVKDASAKYILPLKCDVQVAPSYSTKLIRQLEGSQSNHNLFTNNDTSDLSSVKKRLFSSNKKFKQANKVGSVDELISK